MNILFITNYYPPSKYGWGYMQLCEEVADGLCAKGHEVAVLTSTRCDGEEITRAYPVHRLLHIDPDWESNRPAAWQFFVGRRIRERRAVSYLIQLVSKHKPDVIFVWHAVGLPRCLFQEAERLTRDRVVYYMADYQPELIDEYLGYWLSQPVQPSAKLFKRPLSKLAIQMLAKEGKPIPLKYEHVMCVSNYVRERLVSQSLISPNAVVIHNGVDLSQFSPARSTGFRPRQTGLRCLVAGRITAEKGIHTVIDGFATLNSQAKESGIKLTILGDGPADYRQQLKATIEVHHLQQIIEFQAPVPREQMPDILGCYDILILPSEYDEPLARAGQEAMAMGLLVVGTITGGSGELLVHEKTGLVFEAGNPQSLATQLSRAVNDPQLAAKLAQAGQHEVINHFNIERTIDHVEAYLIELLEKDQVIQ
jgi:glycogen(starch) synthase